MNREDVLRMAREAGATEDRAWSASACDVREIFKLWPEELEKFATAIRSATKEEGMRILEFVPEGMFSCDMNGAPCDGYIAKWKAIEAIRASK